VCTTPPTVPLNAESNSSFTSSTIFMTGDAVTYTCTNPAFVIADNVATCQADGLWIPNVIETCGQTGKGIKPLL